MIFIGKEKMDRPWPTRASVQVEHNISRLLLGLSLNFLTDLLGQLLGLGFFKLSNLSQRFATVDAASPVTTDLIKAIVKVVLCRLDDLAKSALVLPYV